jgi:hypothetical protein
MPGDHLALVAVAAGGLGTQVRQWARFIPQTVLSR